MKKLIEMVGPITYEKHHDPYPFLIHEIIEQMLSAKVGNIIFSRLNELCHGNITVAAIDAISDEDIKSIGTSNQKSSYIRGITNMILDGSLDFNELNEMSNAEIIKTLTSIRGIGNWTAKMYLIFVLDRQDILPIEDVAFLQSYKWLYKTDDITRSSITNKCKKWSPYSSIASRYLYRALDMGLTKKEFHLFKSQEDGYEQ